MAIDASNNSGNPPQQPIAGSSPLGGGGSMQPPTQNQQIGQQLGGGATPAGTQERPRVSVRDSQPASSGSFTNIRNYMDRNRGAGERIVNAVTDNIQNIANQVNQKKQEQLNAFQAAANANMTQQRVDNAVEDAARIANLAAGNASPQTPNVDPVSQEDRDRLSQTFNMRYTGPTDLRENTNFADFQAQAQRLDQNRQTALSDDRRQILQQTFGQSNKNYTSGLRNLDDAFLGGNINQLKDRLQNVATGSSIVDDARQAASQIAQSKAAEVYQARDSSRATFDQIAKARQTAIDNRLNEVVADFQSLPEIIKNQLRSQAGQSASIDRDTAALLGLEKSGLGLYNMASNEQALNELIKGNAADRNRLIQRQEFDQLARLEALSRLAQGAGDEFGIRSQFTNRDLAQTQNIFDAIDKDTFRDRMLAEEQRFRDLANRGVTGYGHGHRTYRVQKAFGSETGNAYADSTFNVDLNKILQDSGYDTGSDVSSAFSSVRNRNLAGTGDIDGAYNAPTVLNQVEDLTNAPSQIINTAGNVTSGLLNVPQNMVNAILGTNINLGVGDLASNVSREIAKTFNNLFGGGSSKSDAQAGARIDAYNNAVADARAKSEAFFRDTGFANRLNIDQNLQNEALANLLNKYRT